MSEQIDIRPGWKTSEFWVKLVTQICLLSVLLFKIDPATADTLQSALVQIVEALFVIVASASVLISYINSRTQIKTAAMQASLPHQPAEPPATPCLGNACKKGAACERQSG